MTAREEKEKQVARENDRYAKLGNDLAMRKSKERFNPNGVARYTPSAVIGQSSERICWYDSVEQRADPLV